MSGLYAGLFARSIKLAATAEIGAEARSWRDSWIICAATGVASAMMAMLPLGNLPWLPPALYSLIPVVIGLRKRSVARGRRRKAEAEAV